PSSEQHRTVAPVEPRGARRGCVRSSHPRSARTGAARVGAHKTEALMALDPKLLEILACPEDKGPLLYFDDDQSLYNLRLKRRYRVLDGDIPDLLIDDAETVDDAEHTRLMQKADTDGIKPTFEE